MSAEIPDRSCCHSCAERWPRPGWCAEAGHIELALADALVIGQVDGALVADLGVRANETQVHGAVAGEALSGLAYELLAHAQRHADQAQARTMDADLAHDLQLGCSLVQAEAGKDGALATQ